MKTTSGLLAMTLALVAGCAGSSMTREESWAMAQQDMISSIANRVTFETKCPVEQIKGTYLDEGTVGIDACGQRFVYIVVPSHGGAAPCSTPYSSQSYKPTRWYMKYCQAILNSTTEGTSHGAGAPDGAVPPAQ